MNESLEREDVLKDREKIGDRRQEVIKMKMKHKGNVFGVILSVPELETTDSPGVGGKESQDCFLLVPGWLRYGLKPMFSSSCLTIDIERRKEYKNCFFCSVRSSS